MTFAVAREDGLKFDCRFDALQFQVVGAPKLYTVSVVNLEPIFEIRSLSSSPETAIGAE